MVVLDDQKLSAAAARMGNIVRKSWQGSKASNKASPSSMEGLTLARLARHCKPYLIRHSTISGQSRMSRP
jgi:hypothetical protein